MDQSYVRGLASHNLPRLNFIQEDKTPTNDGGYDVGASEPCMHAEIGELTLENDFLESAPQHAEIIDTAADLLASRLYI